MIYIASPFFTAKQNEVLDKVEVILDRFGFEYHSPRKYPGNAGEVSHEQKVAAARGIFLRDVANVYKCDLMLAYTDGEAYMDGNGHFNIARDAGTAFEMGLMYARGLPVTFGRTCETCGAFNQWTPPLVTFSSEGYGSNLMIAQASQLHLPTIDHVSLFFESLNDHLDELPIPVSHAEWHGMINRIIKTSKALSSNNTLPIDTVNP